MWRIAILGGGLRSNEDHEDLTQIDNNRHNSTKDSIEEFLRVCAVKVHLYMHMNGKRKEGVLMNIRN